jgi:hypothetical protein
MLPAIPVAVHFSKHGVLIYNPFEPYRPPFWWWFPRELGA